MRIAKTKFLILCFLLHTSYSFSHAIAISAQEPLSIGQSLESKIGNKLLNIAMYGAAISLAGTFIWKIAEYRATHIKTENWGKRKDLKEVFGRQEDIKKILTELNKSDRGSVLLLGPSGIGKTVLLEGLVKTIQDETTYNGMKLEKFKNWEWLKISPNDTNIFPGFSIQRLVERLIQDKDLGKTVFIIDEAHQINPAFIEALKDQGKIKLLMATTDQDFQSGIGLQALRQNIAMKTRFGIIYLDELSMAENLKLIQKKYEKEKNITLNDLQKTLIASIFTSSESPVLPNRAIAMMNSIISAKELDNEHKSFEEYLNIQDEKLKTKIKLLINDAELNRLISQDNKDLIHTRIEIFNRAAKVLKTPESHLIPPINRNTQIQDKKITEHAPLFYSYIQSNMMEND